MTFFKDAFAYLFMSLIYILILKFGWKNIIDDFYTPLNNRSGSKGGIESSLLEHI